MPTRNQKFKMKFFVWRNLLQPLLISFKFNFLIYRSETTCDCIYNSFINSPIGIYFILSKKRSEINSFIPHQGKLLSGDLLAEHYKIGIVKEDCKTMDK